MSEANSKRPTEFLDGPGPLAPRPKLEEWLATLRSMEQNALVENEIAIVEYSLRRRKELGIDR